MGGFKEDKQAEAIAATELPAEAESDFTALPEKGLWEGNVCINGCNNNVWHSWNYFTTVITNDQERWVRCRRWF